MTTYAECVLKSAPTAATAAAVTAVKDACRVKFPISFDFEGIARQASAKPFTSVMTDPEYLQMDDANKAEVQRAYFDDVVRPRVPADFIEEAKVQFRDYVQAAKKGAAAQGAR